MTEEEFDTEVAAIRKRGVEPKQLRSGMPKSQCTPEQYAAFLEYHRIRNARPREKTMRRVRKLWTSFKLTPAQYGGMESGQGGVCAVCGEGCALGRRLSIDHDHESGFVRGLLCSACNTSAGAMRDSPQLLRKLADYIDAGGTQAFDIVAFYQLATGTKNDNN